MHGQPQATYGHREKFGNDPEKHRHFSAVTHIAQNKNIPPSLFFMFLVIPTPRLRRSVWQRCLRIRRLLQSFSASKRQPTLKINADIGLAGDVASEALFAFLEDCLKNNEASWVFERLRRVPVEGPNSINVPSNSTHSTDRSTILGWQGYR